VELFVLDCHWYKIVAVGLVAAAVTENVAEVAAVMWFAVTAVEGA
jgi:hypothetical protein